MTITRCFSAPSRTLVALASFPNGARSGSWSQPAISPRPPFFSAVVFVYFFFVYFFILFLFGEGTTKIGVSQCLHSGAGAHRATPKPDCALGNPQSFFPRAQLPRVAPHRGPILRGLRARGKLQRLSPSRLPGSHPPIQACGGLCLSCNEIGSKRPVFGLGLWQSPPGELGRDSPISRRAFLGHRTAALGHSWRESRGDSGRLLTHPQFCRLCTSLPALQILKMFHPAIEKCPNRR